MRGKAKTKAKARAAMGIIPAGAGKSQPGTSSDSRNRDHPRGCGEKLFLMVTCERDIGSSPRVRGKETRKILDRVGIRIIPAGAGKSQARRRAGGAGEDHPRGCGEKVSP